MNQSQPIEILHGRRQGFFAKLDRFLARYYSPSRLPLNLDQGIVSFSFDDIPDNAALNGAPILEQYGACGTFYVAGMLCGRSFRHDVFATEAQLTDLIQTGHEVGCHTYSHADSQRLSLAEHDEELGRSKSFLDMLGVEQEGRTHAYPYGSVGLIQKYGASRHYQACRGVRPGLNEGKLDLMQLYSVPLYDSLYSDADIKAMIEEAAEKRAWLIFYSHDVAEEPSEQGTSCRLLDFAVSQAKASGCRVETVQQALSVAQSSAGLG